MPCTSTLFVNCREEIVADHAGVAVDLFGEVVERAGVGIGSVEDDVKVRVARVYLVPVGYFAVRLPDRG